MLLDCSNQGLNEIPVPKAEYMKSTRLLNLRKNNISQISEETVIKLYPGLVLVDLRENPINCDRMNFKKIKVKADCEALLSSVTYLYMPSWTILSSLSKTTVKCCKTSSTHHTSVYESHTDIIPMSVSSDTRLKCHKRISMQKTMTTSARTVLKYLL